MKPITIDVVEDGRWYLWVKRMPEGTLDRYSTQRFRTEAEAAIAAYNASLGLDCPVTPRVQRAYDDFIEWASNSDALYRPFLGMR